MQNGRTSQSDTLRQWHLSGSGKDVLTQERLHVHLGDLDRTGDSYASQQCINTGTQSLQYHHEGRKGREI